MTSNGDANGNSDVKKAKISEKATPKIFYVEEKILYKMQKFRFALRRPKPSLNPKIYTPIAPLI